MFDDVFLKRDGRLENTHTTSVARNNMDFSNYKRGHCFIWEFLFFLLFQEVVRKSLLLYLFCIWKNFVSPLPSTWTMDM